jgi:hypothetical protein
LDFQLLTTKGYEAFVQYLETEKITYFLWEEKHWPKHGFLFFEEMKNEDFEELGRWHHPDTGELILFKLKPQ